jgi:hypothetical protein
VTRTHAGWITAPALPWGALSDREAAISVMTVLLAPSPGRPLGATLYDYFAAPARNVTCAPGERAHKSVKALGEHRHAAVTGRRPCVGPRPA